MYTGLICHGVGGEGYEYAYKLGPITSKAELNASVPWLSNES